MDIVSILDFLTIIIAGLVWLVLALAMARYVVYWTGLGRGLLVFFTTTGIAIFHNLIWKFLTGDGAPEWAAMLFRVPINIAGLVILYCLATDPWPYEPRGIQWGELLGMRNGHRYVNEERSEAHE